MTAYGDVPYGDWEIVNITLREIVRMTFREIVRMPFWENVVTGIYAHYDILPECHSHYLSWCR